MTDASRIPASQAPWEAPIAEQDHKGMVEHVLQLGFIVPEKAGMETVFVEQERDPQFPREPLVAMAGSKKGGRRSRVA
jgi:hypothetical protein